MARSLRSEIHSPALPMAGRYKLLASATFEDIGCHFDVSNYIEFLRRLGQGLCLRIKRRPYGTVQTRDPGSFLGSVLRVLGTPSALSQDLEINEAIPGFEWRRRPEESELPVLWTGSVTRQAYDLPDLRKLHSVPRFGWGPGNEHPNDLNKTADALEPGGPWPYLLIVHPWGPDALQLFEVQQPLSTHSSASASIFMLDVGAATADMSLHRTEHDSSSDAEADCVFTQGSMHARPSGQHVQCQLCRSVVSALDFNNSICLFHPGSQRELDLSDSGSDVSSDRSSDAASDVSGRIWTCCGEHVGSIGCMAERQHLDAEQVVPEVDQAGRRWRNTWTIEFAEDGSEGDST